MSEVSLRSYLQEIEKCIDNGKPNQAITHCKHVLQSYPKCVDAYRLLGNAYLESQRFTDASDIFQRVISSIPDDIESHIGMSIIREDEGNLDQAIWHMERAFEVQPSNIQIQDEVRRLYGKRDNATPPRIRLTRGALARLYAKGDLYPQAIGEIRAALNENPNRLELEVLLAETYLKTGKKAEATEVAQSVLRSLPNCIGAIKVMIQVLSGADREMELISYRQKLALLDPYSAYTTPSDTTSDAVPDQAVSIEHLEWTTAETDEEIGSLDQITQPEVEREVSPSSQDELPEWLSSLVGDKSSLPPQEPIDTGVEHGLNVYETGTDLDVSVGAREPEEQAGKVELPDWLKAFSSIEEKTSPAETLTTDLIDMGSLDTTGSVAEVRGSEGLPDWLIDIGSDGDAAESLAEMKMEKAGQPVMSGPEIQEENEEAEAKLSEDFEKSTIPEEEMEPEPEAAQPAEEIPDWLLELQQEVDQADEVAEIKLEETIMTGDEPPDWLSETSSELEIDKNLEEEEIPDWLTGAATGKEQQSATGAPMEDEDELPEWLRAAPVEKTRAEIKEPEAEIPDWREALETPVPVDTSSTEEELPQWLWEDEPSEVEGPAVEKEQGVPEWLAVAGLAEVVSEEIGEETGEKPAEPELFDEKSLPTWLFEDKTHATEPTESGAATNEEDNYLEDTQPTRITGVVEETESTGAEELEQPPGKAPVGKVDDFDEAFSWLMGLQATEKATAFVETEKEVASDEISPADDFVVETQTPSIEDILVDEEAAFTWLENLAVKQDADEASSLKMEAGSEVVLDEGEEEIQEFEKGVSTPEAETAEIEEIIETGKADQEVPVFPVLSETLSNGVEQVLVEAKTPEEIVEELEPQEEIKTVITVGDEISKGLTEARSALSHGDIRQAMGQYAALILSQEELELVASDLELAAKQFPGELDVWQNLGDAYLRLNKVTEALSAYSAAEKLLK